MSDLDEEEQKAYDKLTRMGPIIYMYMNSHDIDISEFASFCSAELLKCFAEMDFTQEDVKKAVLKMYTLYPETLKAYEKVREKRSRGK